MCTPRFIVMLTIAISSIICVATAQEQTLGVFINDSLAFKGYTLFAPTLSNQTYLIDNEGRLVRSWEGNAAPGLSVYLLENGNLLRTERDSSNPRFTAGGAGGRVMELDWEGQLVWDFSYSTDSYCMHHDIEKLPNGNILIIAWEYKTAEEAIAAGRDSTLLSQGELWPEHVVEVAVDDSAGFEIVWEWHVWDHLIQDFDSTKANYGVVADHPERIDLNYAANASADWIHFNAIDYNPELDQIILSSPLFNEIWIIDHSTTTAEAAGHNGGRCGKGGDVLYRWGNPRTYRAGTRADQKLFFQHDAQWIESGLAGEGNILVFNNGSGRPEGAFSSVEEIITPVDENGIYAHVSGLPFGPSDPVWRYVHSDSSAFYSSFISGAQRLSNGNTLICSGAQGYFFEITPADEIVWKYVNPVTNHGPLAQGDTVHNINDGVPANIVFRAYRYGPDYPGFAGRDLTPGDPIELDPTSAVAANGSNLPLGFALHQNYPNPFNAGTEIRYELPPSQARSRVSLAIYDLHGRLVKTLIDAEQPAGTHVARWDGADESGKPVASQVYVYRLLVGNYFETRKLLLLK